MKTKLFLDFDGTLFNTTKLKEKFENLLSEYGITSEALLAAYREESKTTHFTVPGVLNRIYVLEDEQKKEIIAREMELHNDDPELVYADVIPLLKQIDRKKYEINLITLGDPKFQSLKVGKSALKKYFDNIYYTEVDKWEYLGGVVGINEEFIVVDDREDTCFFVERKFKNSKCFCIKRDDLDTDDPTLNKKFKGIKVIKTLSEAIS